MDPLFAAPARLEIVFARGWLSAWEASHLEVGGTLRGQTLAGDGAELCLEGRHLARGEVYVLGDNPALFGFRVSGLDREAREAPEPQRGAGLAELLPFELVCGQATYSLADLVPASGGSILSLDSPVDAPCPVTLRIAGLAAGRGRALVDGEALGILLDEVLPPGLPQGLGGTTVPVGIEDFSTGAYLGPRKGPGQIKLYDFRKPDRFTRRCIDALEGLHRRVAEDLGRRSAQAEGLELRLVDQMTWGEWIEERAARKAGPRRLYTTSFGRPERDYERGIWPRRTGRAFVEPSGALYPLGQDVVDRTERLTADEEARLGDKAVFLDLEGGLGDLDPALVLSALRSAWRLLTDASFGPAQELEAPPVWDFQPADEAGRARPGSQEGLLANEMIALVGLASPQGSIHLVYAARALYAHTKVLERHERFSQAR